MPAITFNLNMMTFYLLKQWHVGVMAGITQATRDFIRDQSPSYVYDEEATEPSVYNVKDLLNDSSRHYGQIKDKMANDEKVSQEALNDARDIWVELTKVNNYCHGLGIEYIQLHP